MVLQNYQNFIEMTSNMIYIVAFGGCLKCPCEIHLNTVRGGLVGLGSLGLWTKFGRETLFGLYQFKYLGVVAPLSVWPVFKKM